MPEAFELLMAKTAMTSNECLTMVNSLGLWLFCDSCYGPHAIPFIHFSFNLYENELFDERKKIKLYKNTRI